MIETRRPDRVRTFLKAVIDYNNGAAKIDCVVKNISSTGARLEVTAAINLPNEFNLRIPHRGQVFRSQLIWRENGAIGVHFMSPAVETDVPTPALAKNLAEENARLRLRIRELCRRLEDLGQDPSISEAGY